MRLHGVSPLFARISAPSDALGRAALSNAQQHSQPRVLPRHHAARARRVARQKCKRNSDLARGRARGRVSALTATTRTLSRFSRGTRARYFPTCFTKKSAIV